MTARPEFYYMPLRSREQTSMIVGEKISRVGFTRKAVVDMSADELAYVDAMLAAPKEKEPREVAFLAAYTKLLAAGGVPFYD